jgi:DNA-binding MarR family transcriptional regulator
MGLTHSALIAHSEKLPRPINTLSRNSSIVSFCSDVLGLRLLSLEWLTIPGEGGLINERVQTLESSLQSCVDNVGISSLCDWDVFAFVYRHVTSLTTAEQIARLLGYESGVVDAALGRLETQKLIERSRPSQGVRIYRVLNSNNLEHQRCLQELLTLSETRAGRLELARQLSPLRSGCVRADAVSGVHEVKGKSYV